jgi:hypothetical protein
MKNYAPWLELNSIAVLVIFVTIARQPAIAGAWPQAEGDTLAIISLSHSLAHRQFDPQGNAVSRGRFRKIETQLYVEHGLTERVTLLGQVARSTEQTEVLGLHFTQSDFRRVEAGARVFLFEWEETLYSIDALASLHTAFEGDDPAASNSGDLDFEFGLTTGGATTLFGWEAFSESRVAYRYRPGIRPAEARADISMGVRFTDDWLLMMKSSTQNSVGKTPSPLGHYLWSKGELSVVHTLETGFAIETAAFRTFLGRNALKETGLKVAFWYQF